MDRVNTHVLIWVSLREELFECPLIFHTNALWDSRPELLLLSETLQKFTDIFFSCGKTATLDYLTRYKSTCLPIKKNLNAHKVADNVLLNN